jgi:hypothetical protein
MLPNVHPRELVANAVYACYGRYGRYSRQLDKTNLMPLLTRFKREHADIPSLPTREAMWDHVASRLPPEIDYLEFGVHEGHSILHWAGRNEAAASRFFGFDSFRGLPEDWSRGFPQGHFDTGGRLPVTQDRRVEFLPGMFQDTLPAFLRSFSPRSQLVVHIDCDLYSSALYCLTKLDGIMAKGTVVIFDEFGDVLNEFKAARDYAASYRRRFEVIAAHDGFFTVAAKLA